MKLANYLLQQQLLVQEILTIKKLFCTNTWIKKNKLIKIENYAKFSNTDLRFNIFILISIAIVQINNMDEK